MHSAHTFICLIKQLLNQHWNLCWQCYLTIFHPINEGATVHDCKDMTITSTDLPFPKGSKMRLVSGVYHSPNPPAFFTVLQRTALTMFMTYHQQDTLFIISTLPLGSPPKPPSYQPYVMGISPHFLDSWLPPPQNTFPNLTKLKKVKWSRLIKALDPPNPKRISTLAWHGRVSNTMMFICVFWTLQKDYVHRPNRSISHHFSVRAQVHHDGHRSQWKLHWHRFFDVMKH